MHIASAIAPEITSVWALFCRDAGLDWVPSEESSADIRISESEGADIRLSAAFRVAFLEGEFCSEILMPDEPLLRNATGNPDYLSSAFYLINSFQEYGNSATDRYGRFPVEASLQFRFGVLERNLVSEYFQQLWCDIAVLSALGDWPSKPSQLFLSHDIDRVFHAWKEDGKKALKSGRIDQFAGLLYRQVAGAPDWCNAIDILEFDRQMQWPATFFWIPVKGEKLDPPEADYSWDDPRLLTQWHAVDKAEGYENGLHTSAGGKVRDEVNSLPGKVRANRNHFLNFRLPNHYDDVQDSGLQIDASLGWSSHSGFRNSYGKPFHPWNPAKRHAYDFLEVPIHLMDTTFQHYFQGEEAGPEQAKAQFSAFLEQHRSDSCISVLWHNNSFTSGTYSGYREVLEALLTQAVAQGIKPVSLTDMLQFRYKTGP